jgi:hypothetical protein
MTCRVARLYRPPHEAANPGSPAVSPDRMPSKIEPLDALVATPVTAPERTVETTPSA